jgi:hypothetical protein
LRVGKVSVDRMLKHMGFRIKKSLIADEQTRADGSVDSLLTELNAPDDNAPAPRGGKLFSELLREYLKDREGEPPIQPDDEPT